MMPHPVQAFAAMLTVIAAFPAHARSAHAAECAARKKFWIGGVPTQTDLHAVAVHVAARLKTAPVAIKTALADQD